MFRVDVNTFDGNQVKFIVILSANVKFSVENCLTSNKIKENTMVLSKLSRFAWRNYPPVRRFSSKYQKALDKYPILMQAVQVK